MTRGSNEKTKLSKGPEAINVDEKWSVTELSKNHDEMPLLIRFGSISVKSGVKAGDQHGVNATPTSSSPGFGPKIDPIG